MGRLDDRLIIINSLDLYKTMLEERGVKYIRHYATPMFEFPDEEQIDELFFEEHIWKRGDKLYKLAYEHYGDSKFWYIIAWFNKKPTEAHYKNGDVLVIPKPISTIINMLRDR